MILVEALICVRCSFPYVNSAVAVAIPHSIPNQLTRLRGHPWDAHDPTSQRGLIAWIVLCNYEDRELTQKAEAKVLIIDFHSTTPT